MDLHISYVQKMALDTKRGREALEKGPPYPRWILEDLFDESKMEEEKCKRVHPRVGKEYQAI